MEIVDEFELVPEDVALEIWRCAEGVVYKDKQGQLWLKCDNCGRWVKQEDAKIVDVYYTESPIIPEEWGVSAFNKEFFCPKCAQKEGE